MARVLLLAGHDTTATMIGAGMLVLLKHPQQLTMLIDEPELVTGAVEELLRYLSIAHHNAPRVATQEVEIEGHRIKAGEGVIASLPAANRDPLAFSDPDRFDIKREARHHLAFAYGPHQCLGQYLARVELRTVFATILRRLPTIHLAISESEVDFKVHSMTFGVNRLPVAW
jgi:cytochrome P450